MLYRLIRPVLFAFDAERAHAMTLGGLNLMRRFKATHWVAKPFDTPRLQVMGITFANPVGLAAGLDKNAEYLDALAQLGFGFIEVGTVTPRPQAGNPRPRLFRIPQEQAVINRMGFNNAGVAALVNNVLNADYNGVLGVNIGKNADTPIEKAAEDYLACMDAVYLIADYITINISSPNTKNLRSLQDENQLDDLLRQLTERRERLTMRHGKRVPLVLKIAPDLDNAQIQQIADTLRRHQMDGVIATNTTVTRPDLDQYPTAGENGGLSGAPLRRLSTHVVRQLAHMLAGEIPIIGVGGIMSAVDAHEKINAGASLIQLYSGLVYQGPELLTEILQTFTRD